MKLVVIFLSVMTMFNFGFAQTNAAVNFTGAPNGVLNSEPGTMDNFSTTSGALESQSQSNLRNQDRYARRNLQNNATRAPGNMNPTGTNSTLPENKNMSPSASH